MVPKPHYRKRCAPAAQKMRHVDMKSCNFLLTHISTHRLSVSNDEHKIQGHSSCQSSLCEADDVHEHSSPSIYYSVGSIWIFFTQQCLNIGGQSVFAGNLQSQDEDKEKTKVELEGGGGAWQEGRVFIQSS